jgi:hypothetical protein
MLSSSCSEICKAWWLVKGWRWNWRTVFNEINQTQSHFHSFKPVSHHCPGTGLWRPGAEFMLSVLCSEGGEEMETSTYCGLQCLYCPTVQRNHILALPMCPYTWVSPESVWDCWPAVNKSNSAHLRHCTLTQMRNVETQDPWIGTRNPANFWGAVGVGPGSIH